MLAEKPYCWKTPDFIVCFTGAVCRVDFFASLREGPSLVALRSVISVLEMWALPFVLR